MYVELHPPVGGKELNDYPSGISNSMIKSDGITNAAEPGMF
jgi:hypothetical protein